MSAPVVTFFNNKGGVGKTSLVYHVAWMLAVQGRRVVAADLDPQANLTVNFLDDDQLVQLWPDGRGERRTVFGSLAPQLRGAGDIGAAPLLEITDRLTLLPGDLRLSRFEDELSSEWPKCLDGDERAFRVISAFWQLLTSAAQETEADVVLVDVGSNLGAINRSVMVATDRVLIPLGPDLFSVQGLQNLGPELELPAGAMAPTGYILLGHGVRLGRPMRAYQHWMSRIPTVYRESVLDLTESAPEVDDDPYCLGHLKHYRSLLPMSYEARKPIFSLKPADGAFGGYQSAVARARADFRQLTDRIWQEISHRR